MKKLLMGGIALTLLLSIWLTASLNVAQDIPIDPLGVQKLKM